MKGIWRVKISTEGTLSLTLKFLKHFVLLVYDTSRKQTYHDETRGGMVVKSSCHGLARRMYKGHHRGVDVECWRETLLQYPSSMVACIGEVAVQCICIAGVS